MQDSKRNKAGGGTAKHVELVFVQSSNINALAYDEEENSLYVRFNSGGEYKYLNVPYYEYRDFLGASSKGKFFFWRIKDKFQWVRHQ